MPGALWLSRSGLTALTWLMVWQRGHLITRSSALPLANSLLHPPHRISCILPLLYRLCLPCYAHRTPGRLIMGREQLAQAGGPTCLRRASGTGSSRPACSAYENCTETAPKATTASASDIAPVATAAAMAASSASRSACQPNTADMCADPAALT